jgi:hypothetical protein
MHEFDRKRRQRELKSLERHALADRFGFGSSIDGFCEKGQIKSVVTPASLAGFESLESVITSLAGFDGDRRPQLPDGRTPMPAAFK